MNPNTNTSAEAQRAEESARSADVEAALETLTREAREQDSSTTREDIERLVNEALANDPAGEFAQRFLEALQAERERVLDPFNQREAGPSPQAATADQQEAVIDHDGDPELGAGGPDYDGDGPDYDDGGPDYG